MAAPTNITLNVLDAVDLEQTNFGPDMKKWLANSVDNLNSTIQTLINIFEFMIAVQTIDVGGSGAGPLTVSVLGLTSNGYVEVTLLSSTNPVTIIDVTPGAGQFTVTFSGDPGASAIISYIAFSQNPQG